jgi:hypothetical protein
MPAIGKRNLKQDAVLWAASGTDDYGEVTVSAAIGIKVRWERENKEAIDALGATIAFEDAAFVDRDIADGSILWLGKLANLPNQPEDLRQVIQFAKIPDIKGRNFSRVVGLIKFSDALPTIV